MKRAAKKGHFNLPCVTKELGHPGTKVTHTQVASGEKLKLLLYLNSLLSGLILKHHYCNNTTIIVTRGQIKISAKNYNSLGPQTGN